MNNKQIPLYAVIIIDVLFIALGLNIFALFHHVISFEEVITPEVLSTPAVTATAWAPNQDTDVQNNAEASTEDNDTAVCKFDDKFTDGEVVRTETSYQSGNIAIFVEHVEGDGVIYNLADIYLSDISCMKAAFGKGEYHKSTEDALSISEENGAILAISGDHCCARQEGIVVRNGILYRETLYEDLCVIDTEGVMTTIEAPFDKKIVDTVKKMSPWQVWSFGPALLDENGQAKTVFNSSVKPRNPRTAIGYYEPGHYCFLEVDGRVTGSNGMSMEELSTFFYNLGCTAAYNLDGGGTSNFIWNGERLSYPYGRRVWDIIYIGE